MSPNERDHKSLRRFPVFFVITPAIYKMTDTIIRQSQSIRELQRSLPELASKQFFYETLVDELQSTNEIEGVRSTKKEMFNAIASVLNKEGSTGRFHSLAFMYLGIAEGRSIHIDSIQDIRTIWENVTADEVKKADAPDGEVFRAGPVFINDERTGNAIHWPFADETAIQRDMSALVTFMNDDEIPFIPKALIAHFFFEYVHPFYDGNGRTGRYLACAYLGKKLDYLTGVNFSRSINEDKKFYYKAFSEVESPKNFGDLTFFIESLMSIIVRGQQNIITVLTSRSNELHAWFKRIKKSDFSKQEKSVFSLLIQPYLFGGKEHSTLDDNTIREIMLRGGFDNHLYSSFSTKKVIDRLEKQGWTYLIKERPKIHMISDKFASFVNKESTD